MAAQAGDMLAGTIESSCIVRMCVCVCVCTCRREGKEERKGEMKQLVKTTPSSNNIQLEMNIFPIHTAHTCNNI